MVAVMCRSRWIWLQKILACFKRLQIGLRYRSSSIHCLSIFQDGIKRFGARELSPNIIKRLEEATGLDARADGFPAKLIDGEPEQPGYEVRVQFKEFSRFNH